MSTPWRATLVGAVLGAFLASAAVAQTVVFQQPPSAGGGVLVSSWLDPAGSDADMYVYDSFVLPAATAVTEVRWRGGYLYGAPYGHVTNFTITFYASTAGDTQPLCTNPQLPETYLAFFDVGGIAGETPAGSIGGVAMYDYDFVLPSPFMAAAGTKYWVRIEGVQIGYPDWGIAVGTGGDATHFRFSTGAAQFSFGAGDAAFTLLATNAPTFTIAASESPAGTGTIAGAGAYPEGSLAALVATPNAGYGFVDWTEAGVTVSTSASYSFTVVADRTLVANFTPAYTITVGGSPTYGGSASGAGTYNLGALVSLVATPAAGFVFVDWTEFGTEVATTATYEFASASDRVLVANFTPATPSALFDFDTGSPTLSVGAGIPFGQLANGITATFSSPQGSVFSIQTDGSTGWKMSQFSGHYLYDNNLNSNALDIQFDHELGGIYFVFATADFHQTEVPTTLQLTAYENSTANTPVGTASAHGTYGGDTMPMGTLSFNSVAPFNLVRLSIPYQPLGASDFFVDNIMAAVNAVVAVPADARPASLFLATAPNPMRDAARISFGLPQASTVRLTVYDVRGARVRQIANGPMTAGPHTLTWDGRDESGSHVAAGAYFVHLEAGSDRVTRKFVRVR